MSTNYVIAPVLGVVLLGYLMLIEVASYVLAWRFESPGSGSRTRRPASLP